MIVIKEIMTYINDKWNPIVCQQCCAILNINQGKKQPWLCWHDIALIWCESRSHHWQTCHYRHWILYRFTGCLCIISPAQVYNSRAETTSCNSVCPDRISAALECLCWCSGSTVQHLQDTQPSVLVCCCCRLWGPLYYQSPVHSNTTICCSTLTYPLYTRIKTTNLF